MITADQARRMTDKAIENEIATRKQRAEEFCETLTEEISKNCEMRKNKMIIENISNELYSYVIGIFQDNGYGVTKLNNTTIQIIW